MKIGFIEITWDDWAVFKGYLAYVPGWAWGIVGTMAVVFLLGYLGVIKLSGTIFLPQTNPVRSTPSDLLQRNVRNLL